MKFAIEYRETYTDSYFVEADSYEEACEKIQDAIQNGKLEGPENCWSSEFHDITQECSSKDLEDMPCDID